MKKSSTLLAGLILSLAVSAHATIVTTYTDNFEGTITQRSVTEGAVTSFAWYTRNNGAFSYSNGKMITTSDRGGIGYFMAPGESFTLTNIGDKIELRVDFTFTGSGSDSATDRMRIGLLGQGATRIADNWGTNDSIAQAEGITGFVGTLGPWRSSSNSTAVVADNINLYERKNSGTNLIGGTGGLGDAYTALGTGGTAYTVSTSLVGAPLSVTLTVVLTATNTVSTELTYRNGETVLSTHTVNGIVSNSLSFDAVGYYTRSPTNEMTGITVTTTAIPEPQTYIMTFGLIALAAVVRRRIKR